MTGEEAAVNNKELIEGFGKIKPGAFISHDHGFFNWPKCKPPHDEYIGRHYEYETLNPDLIFNVKWDGHYWTCRAHGYGTDSLYGNGAITVINKDDVEIVHCPPPSESEYPDIEIGKDLILETLNQIEWDKTRKCYHVHEDKQSPYWMEKMLQAKAKLLEALDILERIG